jgi:hypothetical protein
MLNADAMTWIIRIKIDKKKGPGRPPCQLFPVIGKNDKGTTWAIKNDRRQVVILEISATARPQTFDGLETRR